LTMEMNNEQLNEMDYSNDSRSTTSSKLLNLKTPAAPVIEEELSNAKSKLMPCQGKEQETSMNS
ncbi:hypothetical protein NPIL_53151, partial [Nephila pilipes]